MCVIQIFEYSEYYAVIHNYFLDKNPIVFSADGIYEVDFSRFKHIMFLTEYDNLDFYHSEECYNTLVGYTRVAVDNNLTVSRFYYSRYYENKIKEQIDYSLTELREGRVDYETIYVVSKEHIHEMELDVLPEELSIYEVDENVVLIPD